MPIINNSRGVVTMPAHVWEDVVDALNDNLIAWEGEEHSVREEHAELIDRLQNLDFYIAAHSKDEEALPNAPRDS